MISSVVTAVFGIGLGMICAYFLWWLFGGKVVGTSSVATGRRWLNAVIGSLSFIFLGLFFYQLFIGNMYKAVAALTMWFVGIVVLGVFAFALGALVAYLKRNELKEPN